jgi:hypothetical protein
MFPVLFGPGTQPMLDWIRQEHAALRAWLVAAAVLLTLTALPVTLPLVPVADLHDTPIVAVNYDAGETVGWLAYVRQIAAIYRLVPPSRRPSATVLGSKYGEAGAVLRFGPADGLPASYRRP